MTDSKPIKERYRITRRVTIVGAVFNIILSVLKILFGWLGHSQALLADGLHSFSDLLSDAIVLVAARHGSRHADEEHPYGHARFETVAGVAVAVLLLIVALEILFSAVGRLFEPENLVRPANIVLWIAGLSIVLKEALYHYTMFAAKRLNSNLLRANAWHHRSDSVSSIIVLIGVGGSMAGLLWLDAVAAIAVSLMIAHISWDLGKQGINELVDTGLESERLEAIRNSILSVYGVRSLHELRTRRMSADALVDVHIQVERDLSVSEGHHIGETVRSRLIEKIPEVSNVMVHIDPENDEKATRNQGLPLRDEIIQHLDKCWQGMEISRHISHITLHYLGGKITADVHIPLSAVSDLKEAKEIAEKLARLGEQEKMIARVNVCYH